MINIESHSTTQAILDGPELDIIREYFSVKNEAAHFQRRFGRYVPQRTYAITNQGKADIGLLIEIAKFCKTKNIEFNIADDVKNKLIPTLLKDNITSLGSNCNNKLEVAELRFKPNTTITFLIFACHMASISPMLSTRKTLLSA